jgi:alkylation response protein AidB-like acyl-CoA dehydrogenase
MSPTPESARRLLPRLPRRPPPKTPGPCRTCPTTWCGCSAGRGYLQDLEELAAGWAAVAVAVSVHGLACYPLAAFGSDEQKHRRLPVMLAGNSIGVYSLSEPQAGSDAAALACKASAIDGGT